MKNEGGSEEGQETEDRKCYGEEQEEAGGGGSVRQAGRDYRVSSIMQRPPQTTQRPALLCRGTPEETEETTVC